MASSASGGGSLVKSQVAGSSISNGKQGSNAAASVGFVGSKPTLISTPPMRFLIMDAPRQSNLHLYIKEMKRHHVTDVVRVCECTYQGNPDLKNAGIELHEMAYDDGTSPPKEIISNWLTLVQNRFYNKSEAATSEKAIAVHCVAGLGRAPVLVAIALIEYAGYDPVEAVSFIRKHRRGAINDKQLQYLEQYKRQTKTGCACIIL